MQQAAAVVMTTAFQKHVQATLVKNMFLAFISSGGGSGGVRMMKQTQGVELLNTGYEL